MLKVKLYLKSNFYFSYDYPLHFDFEGNEMFQVQLTHLISENIFALNNKALKSLLSEVFKYNYFVLFM